MAPEPSPPGGLARRSGMHLMAAVAGLAALSAVACIAYMGPAARVAAPAELVVRGVHRVHGPCGAGCRSRRARGESCALSLRTPINQAAQGVCGTIYRIV